jgi:hypothetical protein
MKFNLVDLNYRALLLPDGTRAETLRRGPLFKALAALGIPGINGDMPKTDLLGAYEVAVLKAADEITSTIRGTRGAHSPKFLDRIVAQQAAALIAARAGNPALGPRTERRSYLGKPAPAIVPEVGAA